MPTYRNNSDEIIVTCGESFKPGEDQAIGQFVDHPNLSLVSYDPLLAETEHKELRVAASAEQASITPSEGKKIRVYGFWACQMVATGVNATLRASLSFGTGGVSDPSKVLASYRQSKAEDTAGVSMSGINIIGEVNEPVTLTNVTFSSGSVITRTIVYYNEE